MDKNVWVVDDDESIRWVLEKGLSDGGMDVLSFVSAIKVIYIYCCTIIVNSIFI